MPRLFLCCALCLSLLACGLPKPRPPAEVLLDKQFNAAFGVPGAPPVQPIRPRGVLEIGFSKVFGDRLDAPQPVRPPPEVPPVKVEPIPRAPRTGVYAWQPSAWEWNGSGFVWRLGAWVQPPPGARWTNGRWTTNELGDFIWITGGWV